MWPRICGTRLLRTTPILVLEALLQFDVWVCVQEMERVFIVLEKEVSGVCQL